MYISLKKWLSALLAAMLIAAIAAGCGNSAQSSAVPAAPESAASSQAASSETSASSEALEAAPEGDTWSFTDSAGREVELPRNIERIAPSGPLAQIVLYTLCPDKMVGWSSEFSDPENAYIDKKYTALPIFGNFYAETLSMEAVAAANPQIVIDIGEAKPTVKQDMDDIQLKTGIPTIFVEMEIPTMVSAYTTLGEVTGNVEQAKALADYVQTALDDAKAKADSIPEADRLTLYYGQDEGLTAVVKGTVHADVIDYIGAINVANVEQTVRGGSNEINLEQIALWNPQVVLFAPGSIYSSVGDKPEWADIAAVKDGKVFEVPNGPYNWMGRPPSVNRLIGIKWLGNLVYPDVFNYDMMKETQEFYKLFYHCDITEEQVKSLLANSTYKAQ